LAPPFFVNLGIGLTHELQQRGQVGLSVSLAPAQLALEKSMHVRYTSLKLVTVMVWLWSSELPDSHSGEISP
jgi:hypothetical protein